MNEYQGKDAVYRGFKMTFKESPRARKTREWIRFYIPGEQALDAHHRAAELARSYCPEAVVLSFVEMELHPGRAPQPVEVAA